MVSVELGTKSPNAATAAVDALRCDYAAVAFLLIADKFGVCSGRFMGNLMTATENAWKEDGKLEPGDLERLRLIRLESPIGNSADRTQIRITQEGERAAHELLSLDDGRINEIADSIEEAAKRIRAETLNQMYLSIGASDTGPLMMLLATCLTPGESLIAPLSQLPENSRDVLLRLVELGLVELRPPISGIDFNPSGCLRVYPTGLGELIVDDLKAHGCSGLIDQFLVTLNESHENYERMESFGIVKIRGETQFIN